MPIGTPVAFSVSAGTNIGTSITLTLPTITVPGYVTVIFQVNSTGTSFVNAPASPWVLLDQRDSGTLQRAWWYGRSVEASDSGSTVTMTFSASGRYSAGGLLGPGALGVGNSVAWNDASFDTTMDIPAITPANDDTLRAALVATRVGAGTTSVAPPSGWTEYIDVLSTNASGNRYGVWCGAQQLTGQNGTIQPAVVANYEGGNGGNVGWEFFYVPIPAATSSGSATGNTSWTGTASGTSPKSGASVGQSTWTGNASGSIQASGSSTGSTSLVGTASGSKVSEGNSSGSTNWVGASNGSIVASGSSSGSTSWSGIASGSSPVSGSAAGSTSWSGSASGMFLPEGSSTGLTTRSGSANGSAPTIGANQGSASGSTSWTGSSNGSSPRTGLSSGSTSWAGSAAGSIQTSGSTSGTTTRSGQATGSTSRSGSTSGTTSWSGTAEGFISTQGDAVGLTSRQGNAQGTSPILDLSGSAQGLTTRTGSANGTSMTEGYAEGVTTWSGSASGSSRAEIGPIRFKVYGPHSYAKLLGPDDPHLVAVGPKNEAKMMLIGPKELS